MADDRTTLMELEARRRVNFWRAAAVVGLLATAVALAGAPGASLFAGDYIGRVDIKGFIYPDAERKELLEILDAFSEDDAGRALLVSIDSPGGSVVGGESLYRALRKVAQKKPVVASMEVVAASAAYMTALGADRIFAYEGTLTGSIGVVLRVPNVSGMLDKLGVTTESFKSAPLKDAPNVFEPVTPEVREATQAIIGDIEEFFRDLVAARRGFSEDEAEKIADGRVMTGRIALARGLIDEIGGGREAVAWLEGREDVGEGLEVVDLVARRRRGVFVDIGRAAASLASLLGQAEAAGRALLRGGLLALWEPPL